MELRFYLLGYLSLTYEKDCFLLWYENICSVDQSKTNVNHARCHFPVSIWKTLSTSSKHWMRNDLFPTCLSRYPLPSGSAKSQIWNKTHKHTALQAQWHEKSQTIMCLGWEINFIKCELYQCLCSPNLPTFGWWLVLISHPAYVPLKIAIFFLSYIINVKNRMYFISISKCPPFPRHKNMS